jgi:hypothetical protein
MQYDNDRQQLEETTPCWAGALCCDFAVVMHFSMHYVCNDSRLDKLAL